MSQISAIEVLGEALIGAWSDDEAAQRLGVAPDEVRRLRAQLAPGDPRLLPIGFEAGTGKIALRQMEGCDYREPFFHESVARARREQPDALDLEVGLEAFVRASRALTHEPDALIFHVGRCGSTLLANMLSASGQHVLIKEPDVVSELMAAMLHAPDDDARAHAERGLLAAVRFLLQRASDDVPYRVLKLAAWNVGLGSRLLHGLPRTRAVFMLRSPFETVASLIFQRPGWFELIECPRWLQARFFPSLLQEGERAVSPVALFAHAWRSTVEAALALPRERTLFLQYRDLVAQPAQELDRVLQHLGHTLPEGLRATMSATSTRYSKDTGASFDPKGTHQRPELGEGERAEVERVAGELWRTVQARSAG